jgi:hypothetical protein
MAEVLRPAEENVLAVVNGAKVAQQILEVLAPARVDATIAEHIVTVRNMLPMRRFLNNLTFKDLNPLPTLASARKEVRETRDTE